jgi:Fe-S-cluster-containing hydrogenase component 2
MNSRYDLNPMECVKLCPVHAMQENPELLKSMGLKLNVVRSIDCELCYENGTVSLEYFQDAVFN